MTRMPTPLDLWGNTIQVAFIAAEAQAVIAMRLLGMAGLWSVTKFENKRMILEKANAMTKSISDATTAAMRGKRPDEIAATAIRPIRQKTRSNARRLSKRGIRGF